MMKELNIDKRFPTQDELPRHNKELVTLVRQDTNYSLEWKRDGIVKTINDKGYRIRECDGEEKLETLDGNKWITVE